MQKEKNKERLKRLNFLLLIYSENRLITKSLKEQIAVLKSKT